MIEHDRHKARRPATNNGTASRTATTQIHDQGISPDQALDAFLSSVGAPPPRDRRRELARDGFTVWLIAQQHRPFQEGHRDWVRDLAKQVAYDTTWPRHATRLRELHDYLYDLYAMDENHAALDQAWAEWREAGR